MPKAQTIDKDDKTRPYTALGITFTSIGPECAGACPFCMGEGKFSVNVKTGESRCNKCDQGFNVYTFMRYIHDIGMKTTKPEDYAELSSQRKLLFPSTLRAWGVCRSPITGDWLVPGYNHEGKLCQLYRYVLLQGKMKLLATSGIPHALHGPELAPPPGGHQASKKAKSGPVYRCEGPWDGMALHEVLLRCTRRNNGDLIPISDPSRSLFAECSVIAVPGVSVFNDKWSIYLDDRQDVILYDNDHPKEVPPGSGRWSCPGMDGAKKSTEILLTAATPPKSTSYLKWGEESYHNPELPSGYDIRDALSSGGDSLPERIKALEAILSRIEPIPDDWAVDRAPGTMKLAIEPCSEWKVLLAALRDAAKLTEGIETALCASLASVLSTETVGDQVWLMLIGPPSSWKSNLAEALSVNRTYVLPTDTTTGLFSGFQVDRAGNENCSLANEIHNKTLIFKDGDTLLRSPMLGQIMSQLRALYDRCVRTRYRNKMSRDYEGINTTVIICGTATLFEMDANERGARYLMIDMEPTENHDIEDEITERSIWSAFRDMKQHANGSLETRDNPATVRFKKLCGGYIDYLRTNALSLLDKVEMTAEDVKMLGALATFVSYMRCRPPKTQDEKVEREKPYRLSKQLTRLAQGIAVVKNQKRITPDIMAMVKRIAVDTAKGKIFTMCETIRALGKDGAGPEKLMVLTGETQEKTAKLVNFLTRVGTMERGVAVIGQSRYMRAKPRWFLSKRLSKLYDTIMGPVTEPVPFGLEGLDDD